jgi:hypothetical protein
MDNKELQQKWPDLKEKLRKQYPGLSDEDLVLEIGKEAELLQRLQTLLKKNSEEINYFLSAMG